MWDFSYCPIIATKAQSCRWPLPGVQVFEGEVPWASWHLLRGTTPHPHSPNPGLCGVSPGAGKRQGASLGLLTVLGEKSYLLAHPVHPTPGQVGGRGEPSPGSIERAR